MSLKSVLSAVLIAISLAACTPKKSDVEVNFVRGSTDAFAVTLSEKQLPEDTWVRPTDCRANIAQVLCEVEPEETWGNPLARVCLGGEQKYQKAFEDIYDALDPINQEMFCSLRRIFIEKSFYATGYAGQIYIKNEGGGRTVLPGAMMGVRKSVLEENPSLLQWASWKEQLNFTPIQQEFETPLAYPKFTGHKPPSLLLNIIVHEFGHLFDFSNKINGEELGDPECLNEEIQSEEEFYDKCKPFATPNTWTDISWINGITVKSEKDFSGRAKLCFYNCTSRLDLSTELIPFYEGLAQSDFVTSYAASGYMEDFAEAWVVRWMRTVFKGDLAIQASPSVEVRMNDIYMSEKFKAKREYIEKFVQGKIIYP